MAEDTSSAQSGPEMRREIREPVSDGTAQIDGADCPLIDWSASGFLASGYRGAAKRGDRPELHFTVHLKGEPFYFHCKALIVRVDRAKQHVAGVFVDMDVEDRLAINQYFE